MIQKKPDSLSCPAYYCHYRIGEENSISRNKIKIHTIIHDLLKKVLNELTPYHIRTYINHYTVYIDNIKR